MARGWKQRAVALGAATWVAAGMGCSRSDLPAEVHGERDHADPELQRMHEFSFRSRDMLFRVDDWSDASDDMCPVQEQISDTNRTYRGDCSANGTTFEGFASAEQGTSQRT